MAERQNVNIEKKLRRTLIKGLKIAIGSSAAIYIAAHLGLDHAISAGTIALLTLVSTKWDTLRLSLFRLVTLAFTILAGWLVFTHVPNAWLAYGIFVFFVVIICEWPGWSATISVNAVVGAHLLTDMKFSPEFIVNESLLVLIGITVAVILNLFKSNRRSKKEIIGHMRYVEDSLRSIMKKLAAYLRDLSAEADIWGEIVGLEEQIREYGDDAREYQDNTFSSHPEYYIDYFEMRRQQCIVLHSLHQELQKLRETPVQAKIVADFILYLTEYVVETNSPTRQLERLSMIFEGMKAEPLPQSRDEFENRAILYHILMDMEEFLMFKQRFVEELDEKKIKIYWQQSMAEP